MAYSVGKVFSGKAWAASAFWPGLRSTKLSADPLLSASSSKVPSTPALRPMVTASASAWTVMKTTMLFMIFTTWPLPVPPQSSTSVPMHDR
ncbi:hypothetical protein D3C85_1412330 [compost metagenome]